MSIIRKYADCNKGHFSIWFGVMALPLLVAVTYPLEIQKADQKREHMRNALDSAVLAAVANQTLTETERSAYVKKHFNSNFKNSGNVKVDVEKSGANYVKAVASSSIQTSIAGSFGFDNLTVIADSAAVLTEDHVICVMTLNPKDKESFKVKDGAQFEAPGCSVQINSRHEQAATVDDKSSALAKSFCSSGGAKGTFEPYVNSECRQVEDPFKDFEVPQPGACLNDDDLELKIGEEYEGEVALVAGDHVTLSPGTYCEKLKIEGYNVTFLPGTYIMHDAPLEIKKGASSFADNVTIVLHGEDSTVKIESGSDFYIRAPRTGKYAGLAFLQDLSSFPEDENFPTGTSELKGESSMTIIGTGYFPAQELKIGGESGLGTKAPATSFITYDIVFEGEARISVNTDHMSAGLPPLLPRSDSGARLVD